MMRYFVAFFSLCCFLSCQGAPYMVVTEQNAASEVGRQVLAKGGNAIDAAVAVGYALSVVNPCCGNIGGGGFMLIHLANGKNTFLNFRERAPLAASETMYFKNPEHSVSGYLAVGVPGTVLGLDTALKKYGTWSRQAVMQPAIDLANNGYRVTARDAKLFAQYAKDFAANPNVASIFLKSGKPYAPNAVLVQKDLATTLRLIANHGPKAFYDGPIAKSIVAASQEQGGILSLNDFKHYKVQELAPIQCAYHDLTIFTAPPPSSGGVVLCEMLTILENFPLNTLGYNTTQSIKTIVETMRYGFLDRNRLGDPDFVKNPIKELLSKSYTKALSERISKAKEAPVVPTQSSVPELTDTTHYSIVDGKGNAVSVTYTLNGEFGARVIAGNTGFFLNNEMNDFTLKPGVPNKFGLEQNKANAIAPGKRPLSSMTPTIILKNKQVRFVLGSPGGPRIITAVLLTLINRLDYHMSLQQAIDAPRYHYQVLPNTIFTEPEAFPFFTRLGLNRFGYTLYPQSTWAAVEGIEIDPVTQKVTGANDKRRVAGSALGNPIANGIGNISSNL